MGKGNTTTTDTSHSAFPVYQDAYKQLLAQLQGTTGSTVNNLQSEFGSSGYDLAKPYIDSAQNYITQAGTPFSQEALQPYMDPYTQDVVDATQNQFNLQNGQQQNQLLGGIAANGAFAGDRGAVMQSELAGQQDTAQSPVIAGLYNQGYNTSLAQYNADKERELAAGYGEAGLGSETQGLAMQGIMAPLEAEFGLAGAETGLGNAAGYNGTETQTTTPSLMSQIMGGLESGIGAIGSSGGFGSNGWMSTMFDSGSGAAAGAGGMSGLAEALPWMVLNRGGGVKNTGRGIVVPFPVHRTRRAGGGGIRRFADGGDNTDDDYAPGWSVTGNLAQAAPAPVSVPVATADADNQPFKNTYTPLHVPDHYAEEEKRAPWMALLAAGAGTLATGNIGAGFQKGIESYEGAHKSDIEQQQKAAELENEGEYKKVNLDKDVYEINQRAAQAKASLDAENAYRSAEIQNMGLERAQAAHNSYREDVENGLVAPDPTVGVVAPGSHGTQLESYITQAFPGSKITSGPRTVAQNAAVNGVPNSLHLTDNARDFVPPAGVTLDEAAVHFNSLGIPGLKAIPEGPGAKNSTGPHVHVQYEPQGGANAGAPYIPPKFLSEPQMLAIPDGKGGTQQVLAEQDKRSGQWVTADEHRTPVNSTGMKIVQKGSDLDDLDAVAKSIANYTQAPLSNYAMSTPGGQHVMARVIALNPQYDASQYGVKQKGMIAFGTGQQGNAVKSFNVGISHLSTLANLAKALDNGDVQLINKAKNAFQQQFGYAAPTTFDAIKGIVGSEVTKAVVGSAGALQDREEVRDTLGRSNSMGQIAGVINDGYLPLMGGQLRGLQKQYEVATGRKDFENHLLPEAQKVYRSVSGQGGVPAGTIRSYQGKNYLLKGGDSSDKANWVVVP